MIFNFQHQRPFSIKVFISSCKSGRDLFLSPAEIKMGFALQGPPFHQVRDFNSINKAAAAMYHTLVHQFLYGSSKPIRPSKNLAHIRLYKDDPRHVQFHQYKDLPGSSNRSCRLQNFPYYADPTQIIPAAAVTRHGIGLRCF
jgi:hypothetical protein